MQLFLYHQVTNLHAPVKIRDLPDRIITILIITADTTLVLKLSMKQQVYKQQALYKQNKTRSSCQAAVKVITIYISGHFAGISLEGYGCAARFPTSHLLTARRPPDGTARRLRS